jgi:hypothetical protein
MYKADQIAPFGAVLNGSGGTLAGEHPDLAQEGFESNPMFVDGPQFDRRVWEGGRHLPQ